MAKLDHAKRVLRYELLGLALLILGFVTLGDLGAVGLALDDLCIMLAGNWHFIIPLYVLWMALIIMIKRARFRYTGFQTGLFILLLVIVTWSELSLYTQGVAMYGQNPDLLRLTQVGITTLSDSLHSLILTSNGPLPPANAGGGMVGFAIFSGLRYLFAVAGTVLVMVGAVLAALVLMTRKSLVQTIERMSRSLENRVDRGWTSVITALARALTAQKGVKARRGAARALRADEKEESAQSDRGETVQKMPRATRKRSRGAREELSTRAANDESQREQTLDDWREEPESFSFQDFGRDVPQDGVYDAFFDAPAEDDRHLPQVDESHGQTASEELADAGRLREGSLGAQEDTGAWTLDEERSILTVRIAQPEAGELLDPPRTYRVSSQIEGEKDGEGNKAPAPSKPYRLPDPRLLDRGANRRADALALQKELQGQAKKLVETFESFGVSVRLLGTSRGPAVTRYEIQPASGVKVSRILSLSDDLALALAARDIRIEAPIPGKSAVGIEVPNSEIAVVTFREVLETEAFKQAPSLLSFALGKDIAGQTIIGDLARMPHVLVAGATGSGKSVCINGIIASILFRAKPDEVKFIMIDPKMVELGVYNGIPHLFAPVVTEARRAAAALRKVIVEMERRYDLFSKARVRDLERYNNYAERVGKPRIPLIVVIIDELADLMMVAPGDVEDAICRLAQMARASGIHLVVATQRPSVDVITGLIKANIPSRIAFSVSSGVDSRTILDGSGAEKLLGRGDMLYLPVGASKPLRMQGAFLSESEVEKLVDFVRNQQEAEYQEDFSALPEEVTSNLDQLDPLFEDAVRVVVESEQASVSFLQRRLKVGYSRAARLIDSLEELGIIGPFENSKPREIYLSKEEWLARKENHAG